MSDPYQIEIETEYAELMNKLRAVIEKIQITSFIEIRRHILKLKPDQSADLFGLL